MRLRYKDAKIVLQVLITDGFESDEVDRQIVEDAVKRWKDNQPTINDARSDTGIVRLTLVEDD